MPEFKIILAGERQKGRSLADAARDGLSRRVVEAGAFPDGVFRRSQN
ncbi:hypothetical protein [Amycolatopsis sp. DG1A-15b]|nr:hypothetical protein [Amycolatopsis sp. DG1A-15b]WIX87966.1 hypothetical protein QRY02_43680 [Amycolatopsis sp. DG1A-15b]